MNIYKLMKNYNLPLTYYNKLEKHFKINDEYTLSICKMRIVINDNYAEIAMYKNNNLIPFFDNYTTKLVKTEEELHKIIKSILLLK